MLGRVHTRAGKVESIGAGKTALGEAIFRAVLGVPGKHPQAADYSTDGEGDAYVKIEGQFNGQPLIVEYGFKASEVNPAGEGLRFQINGGEPVERAHVRDTRQELASILGLSPELASWVGFLDGERLKFSALSQSDGVDLILEALRQPAWDSALKDAQEKARDARSALQATDDSIAAASARESRAENSVAPLEEDERVFSAALKTAQDNWSAAQATVKKKKEANAAATRALREATEKLAQASGSAKSPTLIKAEDAKAKANKDSCDAQDALEQWLTERSAAAKELTAAEESLEHAQSAGICTRCKQALPEVNQQDKEKAIATATRKIAAATKRLNAAEAGCASWRDESDRLLAHYTRMRKDHEALLAESVRDPRAALDRARDQADIADAETNRAQDDYERCDSILRKAETKYNYAVSDLKAARKTIADYLTERAELAEKKKSAERSLALASYWVSAFGPTGIPNAAINAAAEALNSQARRLSEELCGGVVSVEFSTSVDLAKGGSKARLNLKVKSAHGSGSSKGESGLVNLIIAETLARLRGAPLGIRWFDEAVNSQDPVVRRNVYTYLREQAIKDQVLIFIVDHHPDALAAATHVLVADKSADGWTTYSWQTT